MPRSFALVNRTNPQNSLVSWSVYERLALHGLNNMTTIQQGREEESGPSSSKQLLATHSEVATDLFAVYIINMTFPGE